MTTEEYIKKYKRSAIYSTYGSKLFPSVVLAQGILESGNGNSKLARDYKNHFGIKADSNWRGKIVRLDTGEVFNGKNVVINDSFRVYNNSTSSFVDRNKFLLENPRYKKAGVFNVKTPEDQARKLQSAGYATDPNYANKIINIINKYNLKSIDLQRTVENSLINIAIIAVLVYLLYWLFKKNIFKFIF